MRIPVFTYLFICGLCCRGGYLRRVYVIASHSILWDAVSVLGMPATGDKVLIYHAYIIIIYSCTSINVRECTWMCMCMVTLMFTGFCVFISVYMYSCMYLLNCIVIDCLYYMYWSLLTTYHSCLWIYSANFNKITWTLTWTWNWHVANMLRTSLLKTVAQP